MTKLEEMAHGQDEKGCFKEPSPRVRQAAENALHACRQVIPPSPTPAAPETEPKKELPIQPAPESLPNPPEKPAATTGVTSAVIVQPVSMAGFAEADDKESSPAGDEVAMVLRPFGRRCPPGTVICPSPAEEGKAAPGAATAEGAAEQAAPPTNALAGNYGAASGPASTAPNMIGDFFGGGARFFGAGPLGSVQNASVGIAGGDRRFKIVEGESPLPTDRVFFDYNSFQNALQDVQNQSRNLDRFTFGVEKTFRDGLWSVELRAPLSGDYNSSQSLSPGASLSDTEFGDLSMAVKRFLIRREHFKVSAGLGIVFPTGQDWTVADSSGTIDIKVRNEAVHVQPFLGAAWEPNDRLFCLAFTQADFDTHGNTVLMRGVSTAPDLSPVGIFQEQSLLFLDLNIGYWIYRNDKATWLTGIAPAVELHYATTMQDEDLVSGPVGSIGAGNPQDGPVGAGRRDVLDLTGGLYFQLGRCSMLTVAAVAPLKTGVNREYDSEFIVQFNRKF